MKRVKPNLDKPHRCPECHSIPDEANQDGRALPGKRYECQTCKVWWKMSPANYRELKKLVDAIRR
jgi:formate dehydrogenase maturation protein FdhE